MARKLLQLRSDGCVVPVTTTGGVPAETQNLPASVSRRYAQKLLALQSGTDICDLSAPQLPALPANSSFLAHLKLLTSAPQDLLTNTPLLSDLTQVTPLLETLKGLLRDALRSPGFTLPVEVAAFQTKEATFVPGHLISDSVASGPRAADVMLITKMPWTSEINAQRYLAGEDGVLLLDLLQKLKIKNIEKFYVTSLVKFMPPNWKTTLKASWIKDCWHLLYHELKIVQPKFILCLGADASKVLLGNAASVTEMEGQVIPFRYSAALFPQHEQHFWREAKVMTVVNPRQAVRDAAASRQLEGGLGRFAYLLANSAAGLTESVNHKVVDNHWDLLETLSDIEKNNNANIIAVDAEWHGQHPVNDGSYLRTVQFSWAPGQAVGIKLHEPGGAVVEGFSESPGNRWGISNKTLELLNVFFNGGTITVDGLNSSQTFQFKKKRIVGHFFNADLEWLEAYGLKLQKGFLAPLHDYLISNKNKSTYRSRRYLADGFKVGQRVPAWYRTRYEGGADTGLMAHAIEETASYKLETLAMRYTTAPRYDRDLQAWKTEYCKQEGLANSDLEGYGMCPDSVLLPYGMYDADVTLRLFYKFTELLDEDYEGNSCREAFWESQIATPAVLEIHQTGITVDRSRIDFLTARFIEAKDKLEVKLRQIINWPDFKVRSTLQIRELLFGEALSGKIDKSNGQPLRIRPPQAITLRLTPVLDTSKPPRLWSDIVTARKTHEHSPSADKQALALLAQAAESPLAVSVINALRDYRYLDQVLKTVLREPITNEDTGEVEQSEDGHWDYEDGLASAICSDGKVRTHIYQTKETGRWASARPNLQNISKSRDEDYKRLLGDGYKYSLRTVLCASPGHVLIEADYVGAELFGMAVMAGDEQMIDHATRNQLPENDPNFYDIHSNVAVSAFKLNCAPTKEGLEAIGKKHIRIVAKSVIFGIAYGRGAKAISLAAKEKGFDVTVDAAQRVIDEIFVMYPRLRPFLNECKARATGCYVNPITQEHVSARVLCNCFGRYRRFPDPRSDSTLKAEFERQGLNFPIQSMIASAMSRALAHLHNYKMFAKAQGHDLFRILLQIHDAVLLEVPNQYVKHVCEVVLPRYMRKSVPIYPTTLDGVSTGAGPYYLGMGVEVMDHWGSVLTDEEAIARNLPTGVGGAEGCVVHYSQPHKPKNLRSVSQASPARAPRKLG